MCPNVIYQVFFFDNYFKDNRQALSAPQTTMYHPSFISYFDYEEAKKRV